MKRSLTMGLMAPLLMVLSLSGCASSSVKNDASSASAGGANATTEAAAAAQTNAVTLASLSVAQAAPLVLANEKGIFTKHGIKLTINFVEPSAVIPTVLSKKAEFGYLNAPAVLGARSHGIPVKSVVTTSIVKGDPAQFPIQLVVPTGTSIKTPADLKGRKIAVDTLFQLPDLALRNSLLASGVELKDIKFVEIPFPQMGAAMKSGQVDAAEVTEPFGSILRGSGDAKDLLSAAVGLKDGSPQGVLLASEAYISANPAIITNFRAAAKEATDYSAAHMDQTRATLPSFTKLNAQLVSKIRLAPVSTQDTAAGWQAWADLLVRVQAVDKPVDAAAAHVAD